jgi:hypothetical protein
VTYKKKIYIQPQIIIKKKKEQINNGILKFKKFIIRTIIQTHFIKRYILLLKHNGRT